MSNKNQKVLIGCAVAGVAALTTYVVYRKLRKQDAEEELKFTKAAGPTSSAPATAQKPQERKELEDLAASLLAETVPQTSPGQEKYFAELGITSPGQEKHFAELGIRLKVAEGWDALVDEFSMAGPQIAVVRIVPPGFDQYNPGELPNLSVIVEDVSREQLSLIEYKDKSKDFATNSPSGMMGMMIAPPTISKDEEISLGRFQHTLEYTQVFPNPTMGYVPYQFMNLMTLHNGLAYVVQYMARTDKFSEYEDEAKELAKTMVIEDLPSKKPSRIEFISASHKISAAIPETWNLAKENKEEDFGRTLIASFTSGSTNKPDTISLYKLSEKCSSATALANKYCELLGVTATDTTTKDGIACLTYSVDKKKIALFATSDYVLTVKPEASATHHLREAALVNLMKSVKPSTKELTKSELRYVNSEARFAFKVTPTGRIVEHKWGDTSVTYAPVVIEDNAEQNVPVFTVAVNKEHEPYMGLDAVEAKITSESDPSTPLRELKRENFGGTQFLTFQVAREESPQGPFGPREEFISKIMIGIRADESVMLKWEIAANEWDRYERYLSGILESFQLL